MVSLTKFFKRLGAVNTLLTLIGLILVIEGIPYFAFPKSMKGWARLLEGMEESTLRLIGLMGMLSGLLLVYISRRILGGG